MEPLCTKIHGPKVRNTKNPVGMMEVTGDMTFLRCFHDLKTGKIEKCSFCVGRCFAFTEKGMGLAFSSAPYLLKIGETVPPEEGLSSAQVVFNDLPIFLFCQF